MRLDGEPLLSSRIGLLSHTAEYGQLHLQESRPSSDTRKASDIDRITSWRLEDTTTSSRVDVGGQ